MFYWRSWFLSVLCAHDITRLVEFSMHENNKTWKVYNMHVAMLDSSTAPGQAPRRVSLGVCRTVDVVSKPGLLPPHYYDYVDLSTLSQLHREEAGCRMHAASGCGSFSVIAPSSLRALAVLYVYICSALVRKQVPSRI